MPSTVVKIDLVGSKGFAAERSHEIPDIRKKVLEKLFQVATSKFPNGQSRYPDGSYYKAEGDALYFIIDKPTVALRSAIEFMQTWFAVCPEYPDCRVIIDRGKIDHVAAPGGIELVGAVLENIGVSEKHLDGGHHCCPVKS